MARAVTMLLLVGLASIAAGMAVSYSYWGYAASPPSILAEITALRSVEAMSRVSELDADAGKATFEPVDHEVLERPAQWSLDETWRVPLMLHDRGIRVDRLPAVSPQLARAVWEAANQAGLLLEGSAGYPDTKTLYGHLGTGHLLDGREVAFGSVAGYEYSNDHYPYYEFVAELRGGRVTIINSQSYFFDVAGIEGMTWVFPAVLCFLFLSTVTGVVLLFTTPRARIAAR